MPFNPGDPNIPAYVQKLPAVRQRQWLHVFTSAFARCQQRGGGTKECEQLAFAEANSVVIDKGGHGGGRR